MLSLRKFVQPQVLRYIRRIATSGRLASEDLVTHRDTYDNNECTPFEFTDANMKRIKALVCNYPIGCHRSVLGQAIDLVQRQIGWVPISAMHKVADILHIPRIRVYEFCTFYTMTKRKFRGKFHVQVCTTTPCMLRGAEAILQCVEEQTCCRVGELSPDGMFGVDIVECQGACANAPVIVVNDDFYEDLTLCNVGVIIKTLKCGGIPPPGPQSGRYAAEPICGLTSLVCPPPGPGFMLQQALW